MGLISNEDSRRLKLGRILEPLVLQEFMETTGFEVATTDQDFIHPQHDFIRGHIDGYIPGKNIGIEIKTAGEYMSEYWNEKVPDEYMVQVQHYMAVTGFDSFYIAAWIGFKEFVYYEIPRDQELIDQIVSAEVEFWNDFILTKTPPDVMALDNALLNSTLQAKNEILIQLGDDFNSKIDTLLAIKAHLGYYETKKEELEAKIKMELGENTKAETNQYTVSWKPNKHGKRLLNIRGKNYEQRSK